MKAIVCTRYGSPDVLEMREVEKPSAGEAQILVEIHAVSVNPQDWHLMRGKPVLVRMDFGFIRPKFSLLGTDLAGRVEAVGPGVSRFRPGDEVFGCLSESNIGALAEFACESETLFARKPANVTFEEAAATPGAGLTALQAVRDHGLVKKGEKVLINGASGGVGTFAVQIAKSFGAEVTGVCSARNLEMVRSIGADRVVDYTSDDFTRDGSRYDLIVDAVGNRTVRDYERCLAPGGRCVIVGFSSLALIMHYGIAGPRVSRKTGKHIAHMGSAKPDGADIAALGDLLAQGSVKPVIDRRYPFAEAADAMRYLETGHARGKVVVGVR